MTINLHISDLLYRYECVILPNFGAFITQTESARVHETTHAFYPPRKIVSFNSQLTKSDGLLVNHIATAENTNYYSASSKVESFVRDLTTELKKTGEVILKDIGSFSKSEDNKLLFEPSYHVNYLASSFGLSTFTSTSILREVVAQHVEAKTAQPAEEKPVVVLEEANNNSRPYLKYAAIGILALGVAGFLGLNYYSTQVETHNLVEQQKADVQLESKIQQATFVIDAPLEPITLEIDKPTGNYHIVAGAFRVEANADKKVRQLKDKGYKARRIGENKYSLHQVAYDSYTTRAEAQQALRDIKRSENSGAWLLIQKLK